MIGKDNSDDIAISGISEKFSDDENKNAEEFKSASAGKNISMSTRRNQHELIKPNDSDGVVISGISGVFPSSENVQEFQENLLAGNDMISTSTRSDAKGKGFGLIKTIDRFDHAFFRMTHNQANTMTVAARLLLERTFEAILDAGYNPQEIKGKNIAVIGGVWESTDEGDPAWDKKPNDYIEGFGRMMFMVTNRISNLLDLHGPSYVINSACSSSLYAFDHAVKVIKSGQCEAAIVCSANLCFPSHFNDEFSPLWSHNGRSAPFDIDVNGYVRAEAAGALFLQRKQYARRIYAEILHSTTNSDGFKEKGIGYPSVEQQVQLYQQFYKEIDIDPNTISYVEAHGTSTKVGDVVEGTSIEEFFCSNRSSPLKIGSLKSNMGHAEAASALCGIIKMVIAFETGIIPANLRYNTPNPKIKGLFNGNLEVIAKPTPLEGQYFALNSFGIGGSNGHTLLSPHTKVKREDNSLNEGFPRLVIVSGRTVEAIECILNNVERNKHDAEYIGLWHQVFKHNINGHLHRGYAILKNNKRAEFSKNRFSGEKRPLWFVFGGMGLQWPTMGKTLMNIPNFAESIQRSHQTLESKGLDLMKIITEDDPKIFENILNSFVGITAIQIALVDVLRKLNIKPDGIVGHSLGELGCAYADGSLTAEQTILAAYYRGVVSIETDLIHGTMVAVGQSYQAMKKLVPPEIDIACRNGPTSCTLSGPTSNMQNFINELIKKKIFVRAVDTSNIAYHSRYIASTGPKMKSYLKTIIPNPKLRSEKWICTSAPEDKWDSDEVKYSSAEYHTNNLLNPVLFEQSYRHIPNNAIIIEIGPHGLLNAILKRSLPSTVDNIPLTLRNHENNVEYLLNALGRLYEAGCDMELGQLYPPIEFPVSKSTPMISPLIKWQHEEKWQVGELRLEGVSHSSEKIFVYNPKSEDSAYIRGHIIDGKSIYPGFGYLWWVVEAVAFIENKKITKTAIAFENVHFENALVTRDKEAIKFYVSVHKLNKHFEVKAGGLVVATGKVRILENADEEMIDSESYKNDISSVSDGLPMRKDDIYKELRLRGYHYEGLFKNVEYADIEGNYAEISWKKNFITFMDSMGHIKILHSNCRELLLLRFMRKIIIDFEKHFKILETLDKENPKFPVEYYPDHDTTRSGGIQMSGWKGAEISRQKNRNEPIYETHHFIPYISQETISLSSAVRICVYIAIKTAVNLLKVNTYELLDQEHDPEFAISPHIAATLNIAPSVKSNVNVLTNSEITGGNVTQHGIKVSNGKLPKNKSALFVVVSDIQNKTDLIESIFDALDDDGFVITKTPIDEKVCFENLGFVVCFSRIISNVKKIILLKRKIKLSPCKIPVQIKNDSYSWIRELQNALSDLDPDTGGNEKLVLFADKEPTSGILGFFSCLRKELKRSNVSCFYVMDKNAPPFSLEDPFYKSQFDKNLSYNVYKNGEWGIYGHLGLDTGTGVEPLHAFCMLEERGNLSSFKWVQGPLDPSTYDNSNGQSLVHVYYSSLNFKDVMLAVGRISPTELPSYSRLNESYLGVEFAGKNENGERLAGVVCGKGISTMVESIPQLTWRVPENMTLEEAASIPIVYSTVIYAFFVKMKLKEGYSVLIHSGTGGIGQAAINICLHYKCNIFTTVGTPEKREFIKKTFPQIPESHIGNSRDTSFLKMVMKQTKGKGVDVVLNSLTEDKLHASILCVAEGGHFLEIGKFDMIENNSLELGHFLKNIAFYSVQLDMVRLETQNDELEEIWYKFQKMLDEGIIKPINRTVFQSNEIESAFRYMASGKHIGKLVIKIRDEERDLKAKPTSIRFKANPRVYFNKNKSYVLVGGLGGLGMELADWLVIRGARNIVLSSRTGIKNGYQSQRIKLWCSYGANVVISTANVCQESGAKQILETANSLGPVAGIFSIAAVNRDDVFSNQTEEDFKTVASPKAIATGQLDRLSRKMCPYLEHFVVFSSAACGQGNSRQTNYGFANSVMERICELRQADNLPAIAIQWGPMGEVGCFAELINPNDLSTTLRGLVQQTVTSFLQTMDHFMTIPNAIVSSTLIAEKNKIDCDIINTVANLLGIKDINTISPTWTLTELGMDSILGIELKQILDAEFNIFLTPDDLRTMTFAKLHRLKEEKENASSNPDAKKVQTLESFIMNENLRNQAIIRIPLIEGKVQKQSSINENPTVFVFPGLEGLALNMEPLAKNLPAQTLCFQYHFSEDHRSMRQLSEYFSSYILENLRPEREFYLIGHSFGAAIAVEVAEILEKQGRKGRIWLIEGSPELVYLISAKKMQDTGSEKVDEYLQNNICSAMIATLIPELPKESYISQIENASDWESKKKICFSILSKKTAIENTHNLLCDTMFNAWKAMAVYEILPRYSLQSPCVLIRCVQNYLDLPLDEWYGLKMQFENAIEVYKINDADHVSILSHPKTANVIMNSLPWMAE